MNFLLNFFQSDSRNPNSSRPYSSWRLVVHIFLHQIDEIPINTKDYHGLLGESLQKAFPMNGISSHGSRTGNRETPFAMHIDPPVRHRPTDGLSVSFGSFCEEPEWKCPTPMQQKLQCFFILSVRARTTSYRPFI